MREDRTSNMIDKAFIEKTDLELIEQDIPLHARPFRVMVGWMRAKGLSGDLFASEMWRPLMMVYKQLYPSGDFAMPSLFIGGVGLRDRIYLARVNVAFGRDAVDPIKCIDIPSSELEIIWKQNPNQVWRAIYSVADLWDFAYGIDDLKGQNCDADQLWINARSSIVSSARTLAGGHDLSSVVQSSCLSVELAMKGTLAFLGLPEPKRRKLNHNLVNLAEAIISYYPTANGACLRLACSTFPEYIQTRYESHGLTRIQLIALAMRSQFVAAEVLRLVSGRNLAGEIESGHQSPPREDI